MRLLTKIVFSLILIVPFFASAAGVQISPSRLEFNITGDKPVSKEIAVANPTADVQLYEIYADDFTGSITAFPKSFTLESGGRKTIGITINPAGLKSINGQLLSTNLSIVGKPLADAGISVGTGVKLPLTISMAALKNQNWSVPTAFAAGAVLILLGGGLVYYYKGSLFV